MTRKEVPQVNPFHAYLQLLRSTVTALSTLLLIFLSSRLVNVCVTKLMVITTSRENHIRLIDEREEEGGELS